MKASVTSIASNGQVATEKEFKKSEYWYNPGIFTENPETGEEEFVDITGLGVPLDNLSGREVCDDGSWFNTKILAGNQYLEDIKGLAQKLQPKERKIFRCGDSPYGFALTRCGTKTATATNINSNLAYNKNLFAVNS